MKLASENNIKVLLDGQGGDELFAGYPEYYRAFFAEILRNLRVGRLIAELRYLKNSPTSMCALVSSMIRLFAVRVLPSDMVKLLHKSTGRENKYISTELWREYSHRLQILHERAATSMNKSLFKYMQEQNLKTLLRYEDRNSMKFSVECRTPFADDIHLIEYLFRIPSSYKIYRGWNKSLLRSSMSDILPEEIRGRRDKIGFSTPEHSWLNDIKDDLKAYMTNDLNDLLNVQSLTKDWGRLFQGSGNIWRMINLAIWKKTVIGC